MGVVRRIEEVGVVLLLIAVIDEHQIGHELARLCVFRTSMPKKYPLQLKK